MAAVVSGNSLGLSNTSLYVLGAQGALGSASQGRTGERVYLNAAIGNLVVQNQDELVLGSGADLRLLRTYNSQGLFNDDNGDNWRLGVYRCVSGLTGAVNTAGSTITKTNGDGSTSLYTFDSLSGLYRSTDGDGAHDTLKFDAVANQWTWTDGSARDTETYNSAGLLIASRDADGNTTTYTYTGALLTQILDASGQTTFLDYTGNNLTQIRTVSQGITQTRVRYSYDTLNRLRQAIVDLSPGDNSVVDGKTYTTTYTYDAISKRVASITEGDGTTVSFTYEQVGTDFRVATITDATGKTTTLDYVTDSVASGTVNADQTALVTQDTQTSSVTSNLNSALLQTTVPYGLDSSLLETHISYALNPALLATTDTVTGNLNSATITPAGLGPAVAMGTVGTSSDKPVVELDAAGNGFAVWMNSEASGGRIYARRYANGAWGPAVVLNPGGSALSNPATTPSLYVDASGNAIAAWWSGGAVFVSRYVNGAWQPVVSPGFTLTNSTYPISVAINANGQAIAAWNKGSSQVVVSRFTGSAWGAAVTLVTGSLAFSPDVAVPVRQAAIDASGNAMVVWSQVGTSVCSLFASTFRVSTGAWSAPVTVAPGVLAAGGANNFFGQLVFDQFGNATVMWINQIQTGIFSRRLVNGVWGATVKVSSVSMSGNSFELYQDPAGNAIATWATNSAAGGATQVHVTRMLNGVWQAAELIATSTGPTPRARINASGQAVVAWTDAATGKVRISRYTPGAGWGAAMDINGVASNFHRVALDPKGNIAVLWTAASGTSGVSAEMYDVAPYYLVGANDTWDNIAATLYGQSGFGNKLRTALGNPTLDAGRHLLASNFPATLSDVVTVPPYYAVQPGDSWEGIAAYLYGTANLGDELQARFGALTPGAHLAGFPAMLTDTTPVPPYYRVKSGDSWAGIATYLYGTLNVADELQAALGYPPLAVGAQLTGLPAILNDGVAPYYVVQTGDTWASIAAYLYGDAGFAAELEAAMGAPALIAGSHLSAFPGSLTRTRTVPVPPYYVVQAGDTWSTIAARVYGEPQAASALQAALGNPALATGLHLTVPPTLSFNRISAAHVDVIDALGQVTVLRYNGAGQLTSITDSALTRSADANANAVQTDSATRNLTASLLQTETVSYSLNASQLATSDAVPYALDSSLLQSTDTATGNLNTLALLPPEWSSAVSLDLGGVTPIVGFDGAGNGFAVWRSGANVYVRHFASSVWGAIWTLETAATGVAPSLHVDASGNAIVAWSTASGVRAIRYVNGAWRSVATVGSSAGASFPVSVAINASGLAVVAWRSGSTLFASRFDGTAWTFQGSIVSSTALGNAWGFPTRQVAIDAAGNIMLVWTLNSTAGTLQGTYAKIYQVGSGWTSNTSIDWTSGDNGMAQVGFDPSGNATVVWVTTIHRPTSAPNAIRARRWVNGAWQDLWALSTSVNTSSYFDFYTDSSGNAIATWLSSDISHSSTEVYAARLVNGVWQGTQLVGTSAAGYSRGSINAGGRAAVTWLDDTYSLRVAQYLPGDSWSGGFTNLDPADVNSFPYAAVDPKGNIAVLWDKFGSELSARMYDATPWYMASAWDTWNSVAAKLYGSASLGDELRSALGNRELVGGMHLGSLPATLSETINVPPYYRVQTGDTWASIAAYLYGSANVADELQAALGNPILTDGLRLAGIPAQLNDIIPVAPNYRVQAGETWSSIAAYLYGTPDYSNAPQHTLDSSLLESVDAVGGSLNSAAVPPGAWGEAISLGFAGKFFDGARVGRDGAGNLFAVWTSDGNVYARRYVDHIWQPTVTLNAPGTKGNTAPNLYVDASGNAIAGWTNSEVGSTAKGYVSRYVNGAWQPAQLLEVGLAGENIIDRTLTVAINADGRAIAAWQISVRVDVAGNTNPIAYARVYTDTGWSAPQQLARFATPGQVAIDAAGNATVLWGDQWGMYASTYRPGIGWTGAVLVVSGETNSPQVSVDPAGNLQVLWLTGRVLYAKRLVNGTWTDRVALSPPGSESVFFDFYADPSGNAVAAWMSTIVTSASTRAYVARFVDGAWQPAEVVGSAALTPEVSINAEGQAVVVWRDFSSGSKIGRRYTPGIGWSSAAVVDQTPGVAEVTIDQAGNIALLGVTVTGISARIFDPTPVYTVKEGDTWSSIAALLYGSPYLGETLRAALGDPELFGGVELTSLPGAMSDLVQVPPYYRVQAGDTWASIAAYLYGSANVRDALRAALGNPALTEGLTLTGLPATLGEATVAPDLGGKLQTVLGGPTLAAGVRLTGLPAGVNHQVAPFYSVKAGDTWASIAAFLYGNADVGAQLQSAMGNPALVTGARLNNLPASLANVLTASIRYQVSSGDTWATIASRVYGDPAAAATLQTAVGNPVLVAGAWLLLPAKLSYSVSRIRAGYQYDADGNVTQVTDGSGNVVSYGYDANGNRILERDAAGNTLTRVFGANNELLAETTYRVPDPDGEGPGQPVSPMTARYVYDAEGHLRFSISAEGRVCEYRYDAQGRQIAKIHYTAGLLTAASSVSESDLATWADTQDKSRTARTDYTYDFRGQLSSTTTYSAVNASGNGVSDGSQALTRYVYDQAGRLLKTVDARGDATPDPNDFTTSYVYDGLGRLLSTTDALGRTTLTQYDDANRKTVLTLANGLVTTSTYDATGALISVSQSANSMGLGETKNFYDDAGRLRRTEDPTGIKTHILYDEAGRKRATIDGDGSLTEYRYNGNDQVTKTIRYAVAVSAADLAALSDAQANPTRVTIDAIRPLAFAADRVAWNAYDSAGRLVKSVDAEGFITQYFYDGAGRVTDELRFAGAIDTAFLVDAPQPADIDPPSSGDDRLTRHFYDADGKLRGTLDGEGYLVEYRYDAAGQLIETVGYATASDPLLRSTGTLAQLVPSASNADIRSHALYNARGQIAGTVDDEGYLTEYVYDHAGNKTREIRYATSGVYTAGATLASLRPAAQVRDQATSYTYTALNQVASTTAAEGTITQYTYDEVGNLLKTVKAVNTAEVRTLTAQYDKHGRLTAELPANGAAQLTGNETQAQIDVIWAAYAIKHTYDAAGRRTSTTDANGRKTLFFYNADGAVTHTINALGEVSESVYNTLGQRTQTVQYGTRLSTTTLATLTGGLVNPTLTNAITAIRSATLDSRTSFAYARTGVLQQTTDALGSVSSETSNAFGEVASTAQALGDGQTLVTNYTYDRRGFLTQSRADPTGINTLLTTVYDSFGRATQVTDARGNVRKQSYDRRGRVVTTTDPLNASRTTTYDAFDRVLTQIDALGKTTTYTYDTSNRRVTVRTPEGITTTTIKNPHGETVSITDGGGNVTAYVYDRDGNLTGVNAPSGIKTSRYDNADHLIESTDASGTRTVYTYDAAGRVLTRTVDPGAGRLNLVATYAYDAKGQSVSVTDANGTVTQTRFDLKGQVTAVVVDPGAGRLNLTTAYTYDARGKELTVTEGAGSSQPRVTQYTYDNLGRLIAQQLDPAGINATTTYAYDGNGNVTQKTDALGNATRYAYDANDRLVYTVDALGGVTQNAYDPAGRVIRVSAYATAIDTAGLSDGPGIADIAARLTPGSADDVKRYVYDADARLVYTINTLGGVTKNDYDGGGRVIRFTAYSTPVNTAGLSQTPNVAELAARVVASGADETKGYVYDAAGREIYCIDAQGGVTQKTYDANGNLVRKAQYANAVSTGIALNAAAVAAALTPSVKDRITHTVYDSANRLVFTINAQGYVEETQYDAVGNITAAIEHGIRIDSAQLNNPPALAWVYAQINQSAPTAPLPRATAYSYDRAGRMLSSRDAEGFTEQYAYDALGNKTSFINKKGSTWTYGYDAAGRLIRELSPQVSVTAVDPNTFAPTHSLAAIETRFAYDALGNVISRTEAYGRPETRTTRYRYDPLGRQVMILFPRVGVYAGALDELGINGVTGTVARIETQISPEVDVGFDALGNATVNRDVMGAYSYKVYDGLRRVKYEIDAERYVTQYGYDSFGNKVSVTRYAIALNFGAVTGYAAHVDGADFTLAEVAARLASSTGDRTITTTYDTLNHAVQVIEPAAYTFDSTAPAGGPQYFTAGRTTRNLYNAYGQVVRQSILKNVGADLATGTADDIWTDTFYYYDSRGNRTAQIDALGYLTTWEYDAAGNVTRQVEYAKALLPGTWNTAGFAAAVATTPLSSPGSSIGYDREITYQYDRKNQKIAETRVNAEIGTVTGPLTLGTTAVNLTTAYTYDGVGNLTSVTDATGARTYSYYDVLGRVVATAEPVRFSDATNVQSLTPLTTLRYDAFGNVVQTTRHAKGAVSADATAYGVPVADPSDQITSNFYDSHGHLIRSVDPEGGARYSSYDALGRVAKAWQPIKDNDGVVRNTSQVFQYDQAGRQTGTVEAAPAVRLAEAAPLSVTRAQYNAFGEITAKGLNDGWQEYYQYDNAGHLWRTNDKDGVDKAYLYDVQGKATAEIRSQTLDLKNVYTSAAGIAALTTGIQRSNTQYDALGRATQQVQPGFSVSTAQLIPSVTQTLDRWGNVLSIQNALGNTTDYRYNYLDQQVEEKKPLVGVWGADGINRPSRPTVRSYYDKMGRSLGTVDANGNVATSTYDAAGQLIAENQADGTVVRYQYDALGRRTRRIDANSKITDSFYDRKDQLIREKHPIGEENYAYDQAGNRIRSTNAVGGVTKYWYDGRGNLIATQLPGGQLTRIFYDARGYKIREVNANNDQSTWTYDYFGRLLGHTDLGGAVSTYVYDRTGNLTQQVMTRGASQASAAYSYFENGLLKRAVDFGGGETSYEYDAVSNRVRESYVKSNVVYTDNRIFFDSLNRIATVTDARYTTNYKYDANGNRRNANTTYLDGASPIDSWYLYDSMNRITLSQGVPSAGGIQINTSQGIQLSYDANGNRTVATSYQNGVLTTENYRYDDNNRLLETTRGGALTSARVYDFGGRVVEQVSYSSPGVVSERRKNTYNANDKLTQQFVLDPGGAVRQRTDYTGYDGAGNLTEYKVSVFAGTPYTNTYNYTYAKFDDYKETVVSGSSTHFLPGQTTTTYDFAGNLVSISDQFMTSRFRSFVTDAAGRILQKTESGGKQYYFYANEKPVGTAGALSPADFDYNYTPISQQYPTAAPGTYLVSEDDTPMSIALAVFGDAQLWYLIADVNGLHSDEDLQAGQQLTIPNKVTNLHNNFETYKIYNGGEISGDTTPTLPDPPPPPPQIIYSNERHGCGILGTIILIAVAVVVSAVTEQWWITEMAADYAWAAPVVGAAAGSVASQLVAVSTGMQEKFSWNAVASAGLTAGLTGGIDTTKPWYEIAQKAALNNAISQGVSIAAGQQEKFDWKAVAVAAIAAPISASAGRTIGGTSNSSQYNNQGFTANGFGPDLANGVARGAVTQGVRMLVDGRGKMDWTKIAADAFGNALGNGIAAELSRDPRAANLAAHALGGSLGAQDEFERAMPIFAESTQQDGELGARAIRDGEARFAIPMESAHEAALGTGLLPGSETGLRLDSRDIDAFTGRIRFDRPPQLGEAVIDDVFPSIDKVLGTGQHSTATSDGNRVYVADAGGFVEKIFSDARNTVEYGLGNFVKGYKGEHSVVDGPPTPLEYVGGIARGLRDFIPGYSFMADAQNNFRLGNYGMAALLGGSALADVLLTLPTGGENLLLRQFGRRGVSEAVQLRSELRLLDVSEWTANQTGALAEARASLVFQRAGYQELPAKLASNNGFDGVFVKHDVWGRPSDIIVNESKFTSTWNVSLSNTGMGLQTSPSWINANIQKMLLSDDLAVRNTGKLLQENREMVRVKINVLDGQGVNRWHVLKPAE